MNYRKYLILASITAFALCLDQLSKMYVHTHFLFGESVSVIPHYFDLTYVRNQGAAFGIFSTSHPLFRTIFFLTLPPVAMACILFLIKGLKESESVQLIALSSIFGGALGNYVDRLRFGYVVDFLDFHYKRIYTYPAFNIADMCIVGGVLVLLLLLTMESIEEKKNKKQLAQ